jgi:hypothetical protein
MISSALSQLSSQLTVSFPVSPVIGQEMQCQLTSAYTHYHQSLIHDDGALSYIVGRGINIESIERFELGFGDRTLLQPLAHDKERKFVRNSLKCTGFIKPNGREIFRGCITFPAKQLSQVVGGYGRLRARNCCWGCLPYLYHLIDEEMLFNQDVLKDAPKSIVLVKSPLEAVSLMQVHAEPCLGFIQHQALSDVHVELLKVSGVKLVKLCINPTDFWQPKIYQIATKLQSEGIRVKVVELPLWQDVNQHLQVKGGDKVLVKLIQHAQKWHGGIDENV